MGTFQTNPSPMLDPTFSLQPGLLDASLVTNPDMAVYDPAMSLDLTSMPPPGFDQMESVQPSLMPDPPSKSETPESNTPANGVGAGPLPTDFALQNTHYPTSTSTLTEFTKRRNWSQRVVEELKDLMYILTPNGRILYVSPSARQLTGYNPQDLIGKSVSEFVHPDDSSLYIREFNESIATGNALRFFHRFRTAEDKYCIFECHGHPHLTNEATLLEQSGPPVGRAGYCRGFFMMARPYPTRNSELLDSFLEHKIENVRLQARIAALKREEAEDADGLHEHYHKQASGVQSRTSSNSADLPPRSPSLNSMPAYPEYGSMPPPAKPTVSNIALTREALDEANASARPDSIRDKMARYEGSSHVDSIEMLTGLRYREGERSHGISTGGTSPALIRGDAGIHIPIDKADSRYSYMDKKHKKVKSADEYVCTDCGTLDSPEWRKGPNGPKTLCNACGLRWAKREKKKRNSLAAVDGADDNGAEATTAANETAEETTVKASSPNPHGRPIIKQSSSAGST
ncbi:Cutinase protein palindrome-binding protein [Cladophialophora carrionii]|uniref:Cutinase protein palindrome-binding protein n=1 Tax=Cladophialophora carrionii TaxID=86049 RepID=A0A1C1CNS6_9EURO|nr:Cutinase protein palindrome-binding protein [Cladophialophora carrionii]